MQVVHGGKPLVQAVILFVQMAQVAAGIGRTNRAAAFLFKRKRRFDMLLIIDVQVSKPVICFSQFAAIHVFLENVQPAVACISGWHGGVEQ